MQEVGGRLLALADQQWRLKPAQQGKRALVYRPEVPGEYTSDSSSEEEVNKGKGRLERRSGQQPACNCWWLTTPERIDMVTEGRCASYKELTLRHRLGSVLSPHALHAGREQCTRVPTTTICIDSVLDSNGSFPLPS